MLRQDYHQLCSKAFINVSASFTTSSLAKCTGRPFGRPLISYFWHYLANIPTKFTEKHIGRNSNWQRVPQDLDRNIRTGLEEDIRNPLARFLTRPSGCLWQVLRQNFLLGILCALHKDLQLLKHARSHEILSLKVLSSEKKGESNVASANWYCSSIAGWDRVILYLA